MTMMVTMAKHHPSQSIAALPWPRGKTRQADQLSGGHVDSVLARRRGLPTAYCGQDRAYRVGDQQGDFPQRPHLRCLRPALRADYTAENRRNRPQQSKDAQSSRLLVRLAIGPSRGVGTKRLAGWSRDDARGGIRSMEKDTSPTGQEHPTH